MSPDLNWSPGQNANVQLTSLTQHSMPKRKVLLCDLTHIDGDAMSSNVFPLGIGLIASYLLSSDIGSQFDVELFKYPADFEINLASNEPPALVGFANYSWTFEISLAFASAIKTKWPETVVVFGGPNYGLSLPEKINFWKRANGKVDFNIVLEGEVAFYKLAKALLDNHFDIRKTKDSIELLSNVHFLGKDGNITQSDIETRVDINELPSPYLDTRLMEKFFDGKLVPLTHTTRGCPFKCTFCSEGATYYNKVKQRRERLNEEFSLIAEMAVSAGVEDLFLSDANYGMFKEDKERAGALANVKKTTGYPKNIYVSTGKNAKERVLNVVSVLDGAIQLSASLQTTNAEVLGTIERSNISLDALSDAAREASNRGIQSYTELIVGLPGESLNEHVKSIIDVLKSGFDNVRIYQLILLPQTKLNTDESRQMYKFESRFRPMPRSFGKYQILGEPKLVVEAEEIVVATSAMPAEDYDIARKIALLVDLVHNGNLFYELRNYISTQGLNWHEFMDSLFDSVKKSEHPEALEMIFQKFLALMHEGFFRSQKELTDYVSRVSFDQVQRVVVNELALTKAEVIVENFKLLNDYVYGRARLWFKAKDIGIAEKMLLPLQRFSQFQKNDLFDIIDVSFSLVVDQELQPLFFKCIEHEQFKAQSYLKNQLDFKLTHTPRQAEKIRYSKAIYGSSIGGLSRIVMRYPMLKSTLRGVAHAV
jgi:radical SAM superfamily enzyme YgiQ (UPF0313 family)